jgi:hypothetical protein
MAVVAVLLTHIEMAVVSAPYTTRSRRALVPTNGEASAVNASRRSRPCTNIA